MTTPEGALYRLMTWLSPAYPVGGFSYSHGIEYAVEEKLVRDRVTLVDWLTTAIEVGAGRIGGALLAEAWRAAAEADAGRLEEAAALAAAWRSTSETALESEAQGAAFLSVTRTAWPHPLLDRLVPDQRGGPIALSVAVGATCACHGIALLPALTAYLHSFAGNLVSASTRLIPLGQSDGQLAIAALEPVIERCARACAEASLDEVGSAAPMLDWCSMRHELQYTRLFRS
ncbi:MAG TPA: urease accessory UreF family protein [Stellaceae bacterium]|nr:urease accessory UreF family protein [Stellaceae bacterium]